MEAIINNSLNTLFFVTLGTNISCETVKITK